MFYFVRHGKTDYSERDRKIYQGFGVNLAPLSETGIQQILKTSKDDRLQGADIILSSPYTRALQTAAILSKELNAPIAVETDLHEWLANKAYIYEDKETTEKAYLEYESLHGRYPGDEEKVWEDEETIKQRVLNVLYYFSINQFKRLQRCDILYLGDEKWLPDTNSVKKKYKSLSRRAKRIRISEQNQG